jgi:hypothetical protein
LSGSNFLKIGKGEYALAGWDTKKLKEKRKEGP